MKIDQIAYYAHNEEQRLGLMGELGLADAEWVMDEVEGLVDVFRIGQDSSLEVKSTATTGVCYKSEIELEIFTWHEGPHWHEGRNEFIDGVPFLSHVGVHMEAHELAPHHPGKLIQAMKTSTHTNDYIVSRKRTYEYEIYDLRPKGVGFWKYIWRIEDGERV
jgi:hypothetical protein